MNMLLRPREWPRTFNAKMGCHCCMSGTRPRHCCSHYSASSVHLLHVYQPEQYQAQGSA